MKTLVLAAIAGAALMVSMSLTINAQNLPQQANQNTRVYGYKKEAPNPAPTYPGMTTQPQISTPAYQPNPIPYGSQDWWREMGRNSHGNGSE